MLYIVATPIGNLQDITLRALEVLKTVDVIYCEDTRVTAKLKQAYKLTAPLISYNHYSSIEKTQALVRDLLNGKTAAFVSDAGTPGIADPAGKLVAACRAAGVTISPLPGASAITALLSVAGIPTNTYEFWGFVPTKKGRQTFVKKIINCSKVVVVFETAPRICKLIRELVEFGGENKQLVIGRELTKQFEEILTGTAKELTEIELKAKGEFAVAIY